ncbi:MAG: hypothetical protein RR576_05020 [Oscillospiraceae bacterium]
MKKLTALILCAVLAFSSCSKIGTPKAQSDSAQNTDTTASAPLAQSVASPAEKGNNLHLLTLCVKNGYYGLDCNWQKGYQNIIFTDYAAKQQVVTCNSPSCEHSTDACTAYISANGGAMNGNELLADDDMLLYFQNGTETSPPELIKTDATGAQRQTVYRLASGESFERNPYFYSGDNNVQYFAATDDIGGIYFCVNKMANGTKTLMYAAPSGGNPEVLCEDISQNISIAQADGNNIVLIERQLNAENISATTETEYKISLLNVQTKEQHLAFSMKENGFLHSRIFHIKGNVLYYIVSSGGNVNADAGNVYSVSLDSGEEKLISANGSKCPLSKDFPLYSGEVIEGIYDNKLIYRGMAVRDENGIVKTKTNRYAIDLETGDETELTLCNVESAENAPIKIIAETGEDLLVVSDIRKYDFVFEQANGTPQTTTGEKEIYALISKQDFLSNTPNYREISMLINTSA